MKTSVLLVDGDTEFRKQVTAVLVTRGYQVLETSSSEEAWNILDREQVDLVAVDALLSGESGIDFASRLIEKQKEIGIVFLSHRVRDLESHDRLARNLDVSLIVHKPMPPEELALKITVLLEIDEKKTKALTKNSMPPNSMIFEQEEEEDAQLAALRQEYEKRVPKTFSEIGIELVKSQTSLDSLDPLEEAHRLAHALNGTAGTLGFAEVCSIAHAVEVSLKEILRIRRMTMKTKGKSEAGQTIRRDSVTGADQISKTASRVMERTVTASVLVVDDDTAFLSSTVSMGRDNLIRVHTARSGKEAIEVANKHRIDAAIIDVYLPEGENAFQIAQDLRSIGRFAQLPISFVSADTSIPNRIAAVHAGASQFLDKPVNSTDFATAVRHLVPSEDQIKPRIFIVDDDKIFLKRITQILERENMTVMTLADPKHILDLMSETRPDVVLLDVVMPSLNGFDVCRVLRSSEQWRDLPILFLTVHASDEILLRCFEAGGDDYIEKPVLREELLARINVRLDRVRLYRERADRDGLTGLATRRAFIEQLKMRLAEGTRVKKPVSLCLIDLDNFKQINDKYGHLAGDRVLAAFGRLLSSRFRTMDVRCRWGGEEFIVAFYGEEADTSKLIISRIKDEFKKIVFSGDHGENFHVTFSVGIASFPKAGQSFEEIFRAVDKKLYEAKQGGRDRIEI